MWLFKSSIGRKFVMAVTGVCLVLFVTFHVLMNSVALLWPTAYNQVCEFLGANWYALVASIGLAVLMLIHIIYAVWLTVQNRAARGNDRYAVTSRPPQVEWASKNMLVLGIVIVAFLIVHLIQFWAKMQYQELMQHDLTVLPQLDGVACSPAMGTLFIQMAFQEIWTPIVYIIGFVALWFHMTHGFWSMMHSVGWDNGYWLNRLKCIGNIWTTVVVVLFIAQAIVFTVQANRNYYTENPALQQQYEEYWEEQAEKTVSDFLGGLSSVMAPAQARYDSAQDLGVKMQAQQEMMTLQQTYLAENARSFVEKAQAIQDACHKQCPKAMPGEAMQRLMQLSQQVGYMIPQQTPERDPSAQPTAPAQPAAAAEAAPAEAPAEQPQANN